MQPQQSPWRVPTERGKKEAKILALASVSSAIATLVDGLAYQGSVGLLHTHYGVAAFLGALLGAITNFSINRKWVFPGTKKPLALQVSEYALASLSTYVALQVSLIVLVELLHVDKQLAWLPAKGIAWLGVSYPMQRLVVFKENKRKAKALDRASAPAPSQRFP